MKDEDPIEVRCPVCKEKVKVPRAQAEREMKVTCSKGHEIPLAKAF